jgi:hypothetical protein
MTRPALIAIPLWNRLPVLLRAIVLAELIADIGGLMPDLFMVANLKFSPSIPWLLPATAYLNCLLYRHLLGDRGGARPCEGRAGKLQGPPK